MRAFGDAVSRAQRARRRDDLFLLRAAQYDKSEYLQVLKELDDG